MEKKLAKTPMVRNGTLDETVALLNDGDKTVKGLSFCEKISYGLGNVFNDLTSSMWFSYVLLFLQVILQIEPVTAGIFIFLGQVVDGLATPAVGILTDKFGTRKLWHFIGSLMVFVSFPLIFVVCPFCSWSKTWTIIYFLLIISIFQVGWAVVQISHLSMIPDIPGPDSQRAALTTIRYTISVITSVGFYLITWTVLHVQSAREKNIGPNDLYKFKEIAYIVAGLGLGFTLLFYAGMRRYHQTRPVVPRTSILTNPRDFLPPVNFLLSPLIYQVSFLYVAARLFLTLNLIYMPLFLDERHSNLPLNSTVIDDAMVEDIASVPLMFYIASFLSSVLLKYIVDMYGNKFCYLLGSICSVTGCICIALLGPSSAIINIFMSAILLGAGSAITQVTSLSITADFIGPHSHQGAFVYSMVTFVDKVVTGIAVVIIEQIKCGDPLLCPEYYRHILAYACGGAAVFGLFVLATLRTARL